LGKVEEGGVFVLFLGLGLLPPFFLPAFRAIGGGAAGGGGGGEAEDGVKKTRRVWEREQVLTAPIWLRCERKRSSGTTGLGVMVPLPAPRVIPPSRSFSSRNDFRMYFF
jgi:hypothetical protein